MKSLHILLLTIILLGATATHVGAGVPIKDCEAGPCITSTDDAVPIGDGVDYELTDIPDCDDSGGNHLNYDDTTNALSCGTSTGAGAAHALLGASHNDTSADAVTRGSLIYGNSTPAWDELVIGAADSILHSDGTDASWKNMPDCDDSGGNHINYDTTTNAFSCGTTDSTAAILTGSATIDFGDPGTNNCQTSNVTVTGAADGDACVVGVPNASNTTSSWWTCWISASNTATVKHCKNGSAAEDPASGTFKVRVIQ